MREIHGGRRCSLSSGGYRRRDVRGDHRGGPGRVALQLGGTEQHERPGRDAGTASESFDFLVLTADQG